MTLSDVEKVARRAGVSEAQAREALYGGERGRRWVSQLRAAAPQAGRVERAASDDGSREDAFVLDGYSAVFDEPTRLYPWLEESIKRGAFKRVLGENPDVRLLLNHSGVPYARTHEAGTLTLSEKPRGLFMRAELDADDPDARALHRKIERGLLTQQSFAFTIERGTLTTCQCDTFDCDCVWEREIQEIGELYEVSVVTFPAYPTTDVQVARGSSEQVGERDAQAYGGERRDEATTADTSRACSESDTANAWRSRAIAHLGAHSNVHCTDRAAPAGR